MKLINLSNKLLKLNSTIPNVINNSSILKFKRFNSTDSIEDQKNERKHYFKPIVTEESKRKVFVGPKTVNVTFPVSGRIADFHYVWLRDHCREPISCHPITKQRLTDTAMIDKNIKPECVTSEENGLLVTWAASDGGHTSFYPWKFLAKYSYEPPLPDEYPKEFDTPKIFWTSEIANNPPSITYEEAISGEYGVYKWLKLIDVYGFAFVTDIPPSKSTKTTENLLRKIAFVRETHYGGFWDFTADLKHGDLAYSNEELRSHTDTTYFTDPCGLQLFHLLSIPSSHSGGKNLLIDGFRAAAVFKASHPDLYALFSTLPVPSHASGSGSASSPSGVNMSPLMSGYPIFNHDTLPVSAGEKRTKMLADKLERKEELKRSGGGGSNSSNRNGRSGGLGTIGIEKDKFGLENLGELKQVRWNSDDRAPVGGRAWKGRMFQWYHGIREWEKILRSQESELWSTMKMGTAVIFDNHRVLHGRSSFTGERRLCGGYIAGDDYRSRLKGLKNIYEKKQLLGEDKGVWSEYL